MIYDRLVNAGKYLGISENLDIALNYMIEHLMDMPDEIELKGKDVRAFHCTYETIDRQDAFFEAHDRFADIQIMVTGRELVDVSSVNTLGVLRSEPENDFWAMEGETQATVLLDPNTFLIALPGDAHRLKVRIGDPETVTKAVFKVRMK